MSVERNVRARAWAPRLLVTTFLILAAASLQAAAGSEKLQDEIDKTVWSVFQQAFEQLDGERLNSVYAEQVLRVTPEGIDTANGFKLSNTTRFDANRKNGEEISLDFWFDDRKTNATTSYEVGFYRISIRSPAGSTSCFYGQFHIVLKKLAGRWKIVQDWDTSTIGGQPITASDFAKKEPVRFD